MALLARTRGWIPGAASALRAPCVAPADPPSPQQRPGFARRFALCPLAIRPLTALTVPTTRLVHHSGVLVNCACRGNARCRFSGARNAVPPEARAFRFSARALRFGEAAAFRPGARGSACISSPSRTGRGRCARLSAWSAASAAPRRPRPREQPPPPRRPRPRHRPRPRRRQRRAGLSPNGRTGRSSPRAPLPRPCARPPPPAAGCGSAPPSGGASPRA